MIAATRPEMSVNEPTLYVAFEFGKKDWKLAMTSGFGVDAVGADRGEWRSGRAWSAVLREGRRRLAVPAGAPVVSCYEAGRDGFWIHRALTQRGVRNRVVDSASIEVNRRARRAKTDRLDALKLVRMLVRVCYGERRVWSEVRVPSVADEAARQVSRERTALTQEQTRLMNQLRGWLATWGCPLPRAAARRVVDDGARLGGRGAAGRGASAAGAGRGAPGDASRRRSRSSMGAAGRGGRGGADQCGAAARAAEGRRDDERVGVARRKGLEWRAFRNRRQIGGLLGFAPTPYDSGESTREQGISRAGNARLQAVSIQLAWNWVRWQPTSALTQWYQANFGSGKRARRIGIVAVARKLVIALWRYVTTGVVPEGAVVKTVA